MPIPHKTLYIVAGLALVIALIWRRRDLVAPVIGVLGGLAAVLWVANLPTNNIDVYYSAKFVYLLVGCYLWVPFVPITIFALREAQPDAPGDSRLTLLRSVALPLGLALVIFGVIAQTSPLSNTVAKAQRGWHQPSPAIVAQIATLGNQGKPFLFWSWTLAIDEQAGDGLGMVTWATDENGYGLPAPALLPQGPISWAYDETGTLADLCKMVLAFPDLVVVTADNALATKLIPVCPGVTPNLLALPPPD